MTETTTTYMDMQPTSISVSTSVEVDSKGQLKPSAKITIVNKNDMVSIADIRKMVSELLPIAIDGCRESIEQLKLTDI